MKKKLAVILALLAAAALAWYGYGRWYGVPTHQHSGAPAEGKQILYYHCPMHPDYHSDKPGQCPICGMNLEPVYAPEKKMEEHGPGAQISPQQQQLYGVSVGEARVETVSETVRAVGVVQPDETRILRVHPKTDGWIEEVYADFTGRLVRRDQPLVSVYSPELLATQQEYLLALRARNILNASTVPGARTGGDSLVESARRRLELWDFSESEIQQIASSRQPRRAVTLLSPGTGYVLARNAYPRQRITPETELYVVADLSRVWVMAEVFESDAASLRVGQRAAVSLDARPSRRWPARVAYIQPAVDPMTRTVKVRLELDNPELELKPDMYVNVELQTGGASGVFVPSDAVLDTGLAKRVFLAHPDGHFEPREVETGLEANGKVQILKGLSAGDRIAVSGVFLVDSETQLRRGAAGTHVHDQSSH